MALRSRLVPSLQRLSRQRLQSRFLSSLKHETGCSDSDFRLPIGSAPLGFPLPHDEHACSVSLPTWSAVVGYEEGDPAVTSAMKCGYPRFVYHPYVLQLMEHVVQTHASTPRHEDCLVLPSKEAAVRCQSFLLQALNLHKNSELRDNALMEGPSIEPVDHKTVRVVPVGTQDIHAVIFPATTTAGTQAKAYWQHTGEVVSSRRAECCLRELGFPIERKVTPEATIRHSAFEVSTECAYQGMRSRIAEWSRTLSPDHVFLTSSGMTSIYAALRASRRYALEQGVPQGGTSIVYGFPYLDTLKMCSRSELSPGGVEFFGHGNVRDLEKLERLLQSGRHVSVLFTEVPSNPLLHCPDLFRLRELANQYDFMLVVDDTISNFLNIDIIEAGLADAVCSSLTKLVSGRGDAMAGSLVANPYTPKGQWLQKDLAARYNPTGGLFQADVQALFMNSADFVERNAIINKTSEALATWLMDHTDVERVYYPKSQPNYEKLRKGGYGGLMSIILDGHMCQRTFYDALDVAKGPSLGTNFTLICPYTLLAHYHELDFAMSYDVAPNLLRISIGLEPLDVLQEKFDKAFRTSRLHPKLPTGASSGKRY